MKKSKIDTTFILLIAYCIFSLIFFDILNTKIFTRYINPIIWIIISMYSYIKDINYIRFKNRKSTFTTIILFVLFYIVIYFSSGLLFGFSYTPYSHSFVSIILNIWQFIVPIICLEITRHICINKNKNNLVFIIICTIIFIILELNIASFIGNIENFGDLFKKICSILLPLIFSNIMYTYYCLKGSYKLVLAYRIPLELLFLIVPIFPDHNWFVTSCFGIITPVLFIILLRRLSDERGIRTKKNHKKESIIGYIPIFVICILIVLFMMGVFKYEAIAILSKSMVPVFDRGDAVVYEKLNEEQLKKIELYTIIVYSRESQLIVHRVINKWESNGKTYYLTKGDANQSDDYLPVETNQILGIYKFKIKYIGYPSVWLNEIFKKEISVVETG